MCALFGYLDYGKRVPWKILQKLVQALADQHNRTARIGKLFNPIIAEQPQIPCDFRVIFPAVSCDFMQLKCHTRSYN